MKATEPETQRPERRMSMDPREDRMLTLSLAYLRAGLSAEEALDSAAADFECVFPESEPSAC